MAFSFDSPPTYAQVAARVLAVGTPTPSAAHQTWIANTAALLYDRLDAGFWGTYRPEAAVLLAAHAYLKERASLSSGGATAGQATSKSVGDWSATLSAAASSALGVGTAADADLLSTRAGADYLALRARQYGLSSRITL